MSAEQLAQRILAEQSSIDSHKLRSGDIDDKEFSKLVVTQMKSIIYLFLLTTHQQYQLVKFHQEQEG